MKYCTLCKEKYDDSVSFCPIDGEVLEADPASIVDTVLDGQYQMEALLGKGGMGAVYRARHILLGDRVAIKVLPPEVRNNAEWLRRFRREGQAARRFRHPNSVTVYDLRTAADGTIYMVMEYVEGHTLDAELKKRGRLTAAESFEILNPIMSVLDTAHSMGVVHRDLKPENIMIGKPTGNGEPAVKLLDLGIAKMREIAGVDTAGNTALTMAGQVLGTPYYMSPEQWGEIPRDGNEEIDGRADIYSLGLVFYEMISGRRCYSGTTLLELRREHVSKVPQPLAEVVPTVPLGFSQAIERATAKDRADRQPTAKTLSSELQAGLQTAASGGYPTADNLAQTIATSDNLQTKSDTNAPTVIGLDASATSVPADSSKATTPPVSPPAALQPRTPLADQSMSAATVVEKAPMESSVTVQQPKVAEVVRPQVAPQAAKGKTGLIVGMVALVIILAVVAVGGFLVYSKFKASPTPANNNTNTNATVPPETNVEAGRYWLMLEPKTENEPTARVAGLVPLASGQSFQMRLVFPSDGYLYIVGPGGDNNQPTAFLTNQPMPATGLTSNAVKANKEFSFPGGNQLLSLDSRPGTDKFTVIFSKARLEAPVSLNARVEGKPLNASELSEFNAFVSKNMQKPALTELDDSNNQTPFVRVKVDADKLSNPIVFEIRIQHN